jgi:hypothetical protein
MSKTNVVNTTPQRYLTIVRKSLYGSIDSTARLGYIPHTFVLNLSLLYLTTCSFLSDHSRTTPFFEYLTVFNIGRSVEVN